MLAGLALFILSLCYYLSWITSYITYLASSPPPSTYDYIVVGGGSAGCVVAGRLAEAGHHVLLVEAGGPSPSLAHIPGLVGFLQQSPIDWAYRTEVQEHASLGTGGISSWPRGKVLGGTSMLNYMIYMRGNWRDYDEWKDMGLEGWGYEEVLPYFKKSENFESEIENKDYYHGIGGELTVTKDNWKEPIIDAFLKAGQELGFDIGDINGDLQDGGFTASHVTMDNGYRLGTFKAFAEQFVGHNLTVLTHSHVNKVIMEEKRAVGVELTRFGNKEVFLARHEVVLCAGAVGSPHILMLSGIGDKGHLQEVGIEPVHHLPEVGQNLQDHLMVPVTIVIRNGLGFDTLAAGYPSTWLEYLYGGGPLSSSGGTGGVAHVHTAINTDPRPDIQYHMSGVPWITEDTDQTFATILPTLSRPASRGFINLKSSNPNDHPIIQPNYLTVQKDIDTLISAVNLTMSIIETDAMQLVDARVKESDPFCDHLVFKSTTYWECFVKHFALTVYHPVGTCAMGLVLDTRLKVKGLAGLRVADGSVMPKLVGGNTYAPIIMIGEKAADMILQDLRPATNREVTDDMTNKEEL